MPSMGGSNGDAAAGLAGNSSSTLMNGSNDPVHGIIDKLLR